MSSNKRRGLAFVLKGGDWTNSQSETPAGLVLKAIGEQKNHKSVVDIHYGPADRQQNNILVVWASPPAIGRLCARVRAGTLGDSSMDVVCLDPRIYKGVQQRDFNNAARRVANNTHRMRALPSSAPTPTPAAASPAAPDTAASTTPAEPSDAAAAIGLAAGVIAGTAVVAAADAAPEAAPAPTAPAAEPPPAAPAATEPIAAAEPPAVALNPTPEPATRCGRSRTGCDSSAGPTDRSSACPRGTGCRTCAHRRYPRPSPSSRPSGKSARGTPRG